MYLITLLAASKCFFYGFCMNLLNTPTAKQISGLLLHKYLSDPITYLYKVPSTLSSLSPSAMFVNFPSTDVTTMLHSFMSNLAKISEAYFFWFTIKSCSVSTNSIPKKYLSLPRFVILNYFINNFLNSSISLILFPIMTKSSTYMHINTNSDFLSCFTYTQCSTS